MPRTTVRAVCFPALTLACVLDVLVAAQTPALPFLGRWKFNPARSDLQTTRLVFTQAASGEMTMTMQGITYTFRIDGTERPSPLESTATWTQTGPRTWRTVYRMAKTDNNIDTYTLSEDGKTSDDEDGLSGAEAIRADNRLLDQETGRRSVLFERQP